MSWIGNIGYRAIDIIVWVALKGKVDDKG